MKTKETEDRRLTPEQLAHVRVLAERGCRELEGDCRRYRRRRVAARCAALALVMAAMATATLNAATAIASRPLAIGAMTTQEAMESAHQMLMNS